MALPNPQHTAAIVYDPCSFNLPPSFGFKQLFLVAFIYSGSLENLNSVFASDILIVYKRRSVHLHCSVSLSLYFIADTSECLTVYELIFVNDIFITMYRNHIQSAGHYFIVEEFYFATTTR